MSKKPRHSYELSRVECDSPSDYTSVESVLGDIHPIHEIHLEPFAWKKGLYSTRIRVYAGQSLYVVHGHVEIDIPDPRTLESGDIINVYEDRDFEVFLHARRALIAVFRWHDAHAEEVQKKHDSYHGQKKERAGRPRPQEPQTDLSPVEQCLDIFLLEFKPHQKVSPDVEVLYLPNHVPTPLFCKRWEAVQVTETPPDVPDYTRVFISELPGEMLELQISHGCAPVEYWRWEFSIQYDEGKVIRRHFLDSRV